MPRALRWAAVLAFAFAAMGEAAPAAKVPVAVRVRDDASQPVAGVTVAFHLHEEERKNAPPDVVFFSPNDPAAGYTNETGVFRTEAVAGVYDIDLYGPIVPRRIDQQKVGSGSAVIEAVVDRGVVLAGRVVHADGTAAAKTNVLLEYSDRFALTVTADETGAFIFEHANRGKAKLRTGLKNIFSMEVEEEVKSPASDVVLRLPATGRIEGSVIDRKTRAPIHDFTIHIERLDVAEPPIGSWNTQRRIASRAKDGTFGVDLPPGPVELVAAAEGYRQGVLRNVEVRASKLTGGLVFELDRASRIAGHVNSRDGSPARDVTVMLMRSESIAAGTPRAKTAENGDYALENVPPGDYDVEFSGGGFFRQRKPLHVGVADELRVDIELEPGIEVSGLVVDDAGHGLASATVSTFGACCNGRTETTANGSFVIKGLEEGTYVVRAEKKGFIDRQTNIGVHRDRATDPVTITLTTGGVITGMIRGVSPEDLRNVKVEAQKGGMREWGDVDPKTGSFRIESVSDGRASVIASIGNDYMNGVRVEVDVRNGACPPLDLNLGAGSTIKGRVTRNGAPVDGSVSFRTADSATPVGRLVATRNGFYEVTHVGDGECAIVFQARGSNRGILIAKTVFTGDDTYDIEVPGASLHGRVTGAPPEETRVVIEGVGGASYYETKVVDGDGRFAFDFVPDGRFRVTARAPHHLASESEVEVARAQAPAVELQLVPAEDVVLRISDADGRPVNAMVHIHNGNARLVSDPYDDWAKGGVYRAWLPPGKYSATVSATGFSELRGVAITVPGPEVRITLSRGSD